VWQPLKSVTEARHSLLLVLLAIGPILLGVALVGGWALAGRSLAPVVQVTDAAAAISVSDLSRRVPVSPAPDELSRLAATFNAMIERLHSAVERERRFTADASHELRAPLAVIRAETTLALDRPRDPGEYRRSLAMIDEQAGEIEELIAELLFLARAESATHQQMETVPLSRIATEAAEQCRLQLEQANVRADVKVPDELLVSAASPLLTRAIGNLIHNAAKVSAAGDVVLVCGRREEGRVVLSIEDHGPGIPEEHLGHIFEPFYQISPSRTPGESHGLGLAICQSIISLHGGRVRASSTPGQGARFEIDLPAPSSVEGQGAQQAAPGRAAGR
jgi:signal transduction histidine kinase